LELDAGRELALDTILPTRQEVRELALDPDRARQIQHPLGGLTGFGSLVYAFTRLGDLLADDSLYADALAASSLITPERIAADRVYDVMLGSAGAILGLLALDERRLGKNALGITPLDLASCCATHLAERAQSWERFDGVWLASDGQPLPGGFCHGTAGITSALTRLAERQGEVRWRDLAERSLDYERSRPSTMTGTWRNAAGGEPHRVNSWCKGAPGIGLGRLTLRTAVLDWRLEEEMATAFRTTASPSLSPQDNLCCGNAGRIDALVQAYRELEDPAHLEAADRLAHGMVERAEREGSYALLLEGETVLDVRLFPGLAGIGYSLLRLCAPHRLPCLLILE
jgi:lantibiotic modifying enzyme